MEKKRGAKTSTVHDPRPDMIIIHSYPLAAEEEKHSRYQKSKELKRGTRPEGDERANPTGTRRAQSRAHPARPDPWVPPRGEAHHIQAAVPVLLLL